MQIAINRWPRGRPHFEEWRSQELPTVWLLIDRDRGLIARNGEKADEFRMSVLRWKEALRSGCLIVGYDLKPIISENALDVELSDDGSTATFIYETWNGDKARYAPKVRVTPIDGGAALYRVLFARQKRGESSAYLLDLKQLGAREPADLDDMLEVTREALRRHQEHPIGLPATSVISDGTIVEHYFRAMGIRPLLDKFSNIPAQVHEAGIAAYHGGWTDTFVSGVSEGIYTDVEGMYPAMMQFLGVPAAVAAQEARWDTPDLATALEELPGHPFVLLEVEPRGHVLPVKYRERSEDEWATSIAAPLTTKGTYWVTVWDYLLGIARFDSRPNVVRTVRVKFHGRQEGLRELTHKGRTITIDNFLPTLIELKREDKATWKTIVNSIYGKFGQLSPGPGYLTFPIIAACITAAARLTLGQTMNAVELTGGKVIMCDTDSMFVSGLTRTEFQDIRRSFLFLCDWKWEEVNDPQPLYCNAIAPKRYQLFGEEGIRDKSDLVIGNYLLTEDQLQEAAGYLAELREMPDWGDEVALIKSVVSIPLYKQLERQFPLFSPLYLRTPRFTPHYNKSRAMFCATNPDSGAWVNVSTGLTGVDVEWRTYADVLTEMRVATSRRYLTPNGETPPIGYKGELTQMPITATREIRAGRQGYRQQDQQIGLYRPEEETEDYWQTIILPHLKKCSTADVARISGLDESTIKRAKRGQVPYRSNQTKILMSVAAINNVLDYHRNPSRSRIRYALDELSKEAA